MVKSIKQTYYINALVNEVWMALVDPKYIDEWGGGPAKMSDKEGYEFELWGGDIWGKNIKVIQNKKLVQEWFGGNWDKPSIVTFELSTRDKDTLIKLTHIDVPDAEFSEIEKGWKEYYFEPLKDYLESTSN